MAEPARWYVVHTYSGYENKVMTNLEKTVENRKRFTHRFHSLRFTLFFLSNFLPFHRKRDIRVAHRTRKKNGTQAELLMIFAPKSNTKTTVRHSAKKYAFSST